MRKIYNTSKIENSVKRWVAKLANAHAADYTPDDGAYGYLNDMCKGGLGLGIVNPLIYTKDIEAFFKRHSVDIESLIEAWEIDSGEPLKTPGSVDRITYHVRFAVKMCTNQLLAAVGL